MKIVIFGTERRVGLLDGNRVMDVNKAASSYLATKMGVPNAVMEANRRAPSDLEEFIAAGQDALDLTRDALGHLNDAGDTSIMCELESAALTAPWPRRRIFCAGANYPRHVANYYTRHGKPTSPENVIASTRACEPAGFTKDSVDVMGPGDNVLYPQRSSLFDYEAEVAVVIGKRGKDIPAGDGASYVWGVTLANDWSDRSKVGPGSLSVSFNLMKNFDCCLSLGPSILAGGVDPQDIDITLRVNGQLRQDYNSRGMIYSFAEYIEYLSIDYTLVPGDIILGGTDYGTAADASERDSNGNPALDLFLKVGDNVEVASPAIGKLSNRIVNKQ